MIRKMSLRLSPTKFRCLVVVAALGLSVSDVVADPLNCSLSQYKATSGLTAVADAATLTLTWDGDRNQELRLRLGDHRGHTDDPGSLGTETRRSVGEPRGQRDARVSRCLRHPPHGQPEPRGIEEKRYHRDHEADLRRVGMGYVLGRAAASPRRRGRFKRRTPGVPRKPEEVKRGTAVYRAERCDVVTDGARINVVFPGVSLGVFEGRLQFTVYKGTNLIRQEVIASTTDTSRLQVRRRPQGAVDWLRHTRLVARYGEQPAVVLVRGRDERAGVAPQDEEPRRHRRARQGRIDRRVSTAAQFFLGARERA